MVVVVGDMYGDAVLAANMPGGLSYSQWYWPGFAKHDGGLR